MKTALRLTAFALAATLATAGTSLAEDPAGSTSTHPPRDPAPARIVPVVPTPVDPTGPNVGAFDRVLPPALGLPELTPNPGLADDRDIDLVLLGATDLAYGHDVCHGLITCCNSYWVQGCDADQFEAICSYYEGTVETQIFSDGSTQYECHAE